MDKKVKVAFYMPEELNTAMWNHINESTSGSSSYGAISNLVTHAVSEYLNYSTEAPQTQFTTTNILNYKENNIEEKEPCAK